MPKGEIFIQYGKITIGGSATVASIQQIEESLTRVLKEHGYPEEMSVQQASDAINHLTHDDVKLDKTTREPTMEEIENMAKRVEHDRK